MTVFPRTVNAFFVRLQRLFPLEGITLLCISASLFLPVEKPLHQRLRRGIMGMIFLMGGGVQMAKHLDKFTSPFQESRIPFLLAEPLTNGQAKWWI